VYGLHIRYRVFSLCQSTWPIVIIPECASWLHDTTHKFETIPIPEPTGIQAPVFIISP
jgi:hypothetical protein